MPESLAPPGYTAHESGLLLPVDLSASHFGGQTNSQTPDPWLVDWFAGGGRRSSAGQRVTPQGSLALPAYYACLNVIAQDCAKLPLVVYERMAEGRRKADEHWLWPIVMDEFNEDMTAYVGREVMSHHAPGWGNAYGFILRDRSMSRREGEVIGIYPIHPSRVWPERDDATGDLQYRVYRGDTLRQRTQDVPDIVPASDMIHLKGLSTDGLVGFSVAQIAAESIGLGLAAQQYGASFFGNGGMPSGLLTHPGKFKDEEAIRKLKERWDNAGNGTRVLEDGLTWTDVTVPPEQAQFLLTQQFSVIQICRMFRMSPHKVQDLTNAHFDNIETSNIDHTVDTMMPWHIRWEQEINRKLLKGTPFYVKHDVRALMRGDSKARAEYYRSQFMIGALSPNDIRELEEQNPFPGGEEYFLQIQYAPIRKIVDGTARQPRQAQRPLSPGDTTAHVNGYQNGHHALMVADE